MLPFYPLTEFYARAARPLPTLEPLAPAAVPEPYRRLLVHGNDMTPTLEQFHGERIVLQLIHRHAEADGLAREVALTLVGSSKRVEYGAILIHRAAFPEAAWEQVLGCRIPLGTLLAEHVLQHVSRPQAYFRVTADDHIREALGLEGDHLLYGRHNRLLTGDDLVIADVVEILPPA